MFNALTIFENLPTRHWNLISKSKPIFVFVTFYRYYSSEEEFLEMVEKVKRGDIVGVEGMPGISDDWLQDFWQEKKRKKCFFRCMKKTNS